MKVVETCLLPGNEDGINKAADLLRKGKLVAIPTETVYGLAANALDGAAVKRIFEAKGRPQDNPLIVHIADLNEIDKLVTDIPKIARKYAEQFWPGPLTMIFHRSEIIPSQVSAGLSTVAVRMPSHPIARAIIRAAGVPLAAPSANRSGSPSPTEPAHVMTDLQGRISAVVDGGKCDIGVESTVVDLTGDMPRLLRPGGITPDMLRSVGGGLQIDPSVTSKLGEGMVATSPGMKYKHYAPQANLILVKGSPDAFASFVNSHNEEGTVAMCFDGEETALHLPFVTYGRREDAETQAHRLFDVLRHFDETNVKTVYCSCPDTCDMGLAVYNRLLRAAGFEVITLD